MVRLLVESHACVDDKRAGDRLGWDPRVFGTSPHLKATDRVLEEHSDPRTVAMLANPMETQLVGSLGVKIGGDTLDQDPMELVRGQMEGAESTLGARNRPTWTPESRERLRRLVLNHIVRDRLFESDLKQAKTITTMTHTDLVTTVSNGTLRIAEARTLFENTRASNGVVHLIDNVLVPAESPQEETVDGP